MPKITEHGGPSFKPVTEEQYTRAMEKHGTPEFTADDQAVVDRWNEQQGRGEDESAGNSSSTSSASQRKSDDRTVIEPPSPAPSTANPSSEAPKENSSARQTGGSGTGSKGK